MKFVRRRARIVAVVDTRARDAFRLEVAASEAWNAFQHPYAYAAFRGIDYVETRLLETESRAT